MAILRVGGSGSPLAELRVPICRSRVDACWSITNICRSLGDCLKCGSQDEVASREMRDASCNSQMSRNGEFSVICLWRIHGVPCNSFVLSGIDFIFGMVLV